MDFLIVARILGVLGYATCAAMMLPMLYAAFIGEFESVQVFVYALVLGATTSGFLFETGGTMRKDDFSLQEGIAITALGWLLVSVIAMQPYLYSGALGVLDSLTESVAGFSGTGATVIEDLAVLSRSVALWRSMTNWIGGLGIVVVFMAILPQFGRGAVYMMQAESTGTNKDRQLPRIKDNAIALFKLYVAFTTVCTVAYCLCGMTAYDAVNHGMTTIATGGFSTYSASFIYFDSPLVEGVSTFFMLLASGSFSMYLVAWRHGWRIIWRSTEYRVFLGAFVVATLLIVLDLVTEMGMAADSALRFASFQVASIGSSTGFVSYDFDIWPSFSKTLLLALMFMGGCGGSTSGGFKVIRVILLVKMIRAFVRRKLHPQMLTQITLDGAVIPAEVLNGVARHFFVYTMLGVAFAFCMVFDGVSMIDSVSVAISTLGSVGPGFGIAGATSTYATLPPFSKIAATVSMYLGRLEIFTVLALFLPEFWHKHKGW